MYYGVNWQPSWLLSSLHSSRCHETYLARIEYHGINSIEIVFHCTRQTILIESINPIILIIHRHYSFNNQIPLRRLLLVRILHAAVHLPFVFSE